MNTQHDVHQADLDRLKRLRLMDDDFLVQIFEGNCEVTELLLNIVLERSDIRVSKIMTQKEYRSISERTIKLDIYAEDADGKAYDVEVQRADRGAIPQRARFYSSMMDSRLLDKGQRFSQLTESYVIFITEKDVLGANCALYHIDRTIREMQHSNFEDGAHIVYVNGSYHNNTDPVGRLMHDFRCADPDEMYYPLLAERARYFKESEGGQKTMCKIMEDMRNETAEQTKLDTAQELLKMGILTLEQIAQAAKLPLETVQKLAAQEPHTTQQ
jgi:hypothetical protein